MSDVTTKTIESQKLVDDALVDLKQSKLSKALDKFAAAEAIDPANANIFRQRGILYARQGDLDGAIDEFDRAVGLNPSDVQAFYFRGIAYSRKGDTKSASVDFYKTLALNPNHIKAKEKLALINTPEAAKVRSRAAPTKRRFFQLGLTDAQKQAAKLYHPWRRLFARYIDLVLVATIAQIVLAVISPDLEINAFVWSMLAGLFLIPIESIQIVLFGSTAGKSLYGIKVVSSDGKKLKFSQALFRSVKIYFWGVACYIPIFLPIFMNIQYKRLLDNGYSGWDFKNDSIVIHRDIGVARKLLLALTWLVILFFVVVGHVIENEERALRLSHSNALHVPVVSDGTLTGRIVDQTATLTPTDIATLSNAMKDLETRKGSQIALLIVPTTKPEEIEQFSIRVADAWKIGRKKVDDGILVIIAKDDHKMRIEVGTGSVMPDDTAKSIIAADFIPNFKEGKYVDGITAGMTRIFKVADGKQMSPQVRSAVSLTPDAVSDSNVCTDKRALVRAWERTSIGRYFSDVGVYIDNSKAKIKQSKASTLDEAKMQKLATHFIDELDDIVYSRHLYFLDSSYDGLVSAQNGFGAGIRCSSSVTLDAPNVLVDLLTLRHQVAVYAIWLLQLLKNFLTMALLSSGLQE